MRSPQIISPTSSLLQVTSLEHTELTKGTLGCLGSARQARLRGAATPGEAFLSPKDCKLGCSTGSGEGGGSNTLKSGEELLTSPTQLESIRPGAGV